MTIVPIPDRIRRRAQKLQREAENCLLLAIREPLSDFAADLIAEAEMLIRRAHELAEA
jgi:rhodanese-related sulfurtransferase